MTDPIGAILDLLQREGGSAYHGEPVTQLEHALQAAAAAERAGASPALVAAALLHDLGHLLPAEDFSEAHEEAGARWLAPFFGPEVVEPIRLHVPAKRYLCFAKAAYRASLSAASLASLRVQGGPFTPEQAERFRREPHAEGALALRRWDEAAKVPGLPTPGLAHFRTCLEAVLLPAATSKEERS
jgi:phosphonate degradation associated HDIG domain protein